MFALKLFSRPAFAVAPVALAAATAFASQSMAAADANESPLSPNDWRKFKVIDIKELTHDTRKYTVAVPGDAGLKVASLVMLQMDVDGKKLARPYTPTSSVHQRDTMDFIIKSYPTGKVSKALGEMKVGQEVEIKGPYTKYVYTPNQWKRVGLLAGGSGITPMYQLIQEILSNPRDTTQVTLLYASRTPADIILKAELDALSVVHPNFKVIYTVQDVPQGKEWNGPKGFITKEQLQEHLPSASAGTDIKVMVCGPPPFYRTYSGEKVSPADQGPLVGLLKDLGYTEAQVFKY